MSDFGLVIITRKRVKQSLERVLTEPCPYCSGTGVIKSSSTICYEILSEVKKVGPDLNGHRLLLRVNPDIARALKEEEQRGASRDLKQSIGKDVTIKADVAPASRAVRRDGGVSGRAGQVGQVGRVGRCGRIESAASASPGGTGANRQPRRRHARSRAARRLTRTSLQRQPLTSVARSGIATGARLDAGEARRDGEEDHGAARGSSRSHGCC